MLEDAEVLAVDASGLGHAANRLIADHFSRHSNLDVDLEALAALMVDSEGHARPEVRAPPAVVDVVCNRPVY